MTFSNWVKKNSNKLTNVSKLTLNDWINNRNLPDWKERNNILWNNHCQDDIKDDDGFIFTGNIEINDEFILKLFIGDNNKIKAEIAHPYFMKKHPEIQEYLKNRFTPFIDNITVIRCIQNNLNEPPRCKICGKYISFINNAYCSSKCQNNDKELNKIKGEKVKKTKLNWSDDKKKEVYNKVKETRNNWSEEKKKEFNKKISDTHKDPEIENRRKVSCENTCLKKYGEKYYFQTEDFKNKSRDSCNKKYDCDYYVQTEDFKNKSQNTNLKKYGVKYVSQNENILKKMEKTTFERYGVKNPRQSKFFQEKAQETTLKKYGVISYSQTKEFKDRLSKLRYEYNGIGFDSSWELAFYIYHKDNNLPIEREPLYLEFEFKGKKHRYFPDFKIEDKLIEIKNPTFFNKEGKMIDLFNHNDDLAEAKHQCMIKNNVIIITNVDNYLNYIKHSYGNKYLDKFKIIKGRV